MATRKVGEAPAGTVGELPTDRAGLETMRGDLAARAATLNADISKEPKNSPKRALLVDEKMVVDRQLSRTNRALKRANIEAAQGEGADGAEGGGDDQAYALAMPGVREREVLDIARAILKGPRAARYVDNDSDLDAAQLAEDAWAVFHEVMGEGGGERE